MRRRISSGGKFKKPLIFAAQITYMQVWKDYQEKNKERFLSEMLDLLRIPSVSAKSEHKPDMVK